MAGEFPATWRLITLEDCMDAIIDYRGKTPRKTAFGIPLITAKVVKSGRIETPDEFIDPSDYNDWMRRGMPKVGDILITTEAPLGEVAQITDAKIALAQRLIALRGREGQVDNTFLKFLMQSSFVQSQLRARETGTTVLGIKQSELRKVLLPLPDLVEQQDIACILGTLDDKIELNRKMNETLEAMARAIFKSWFVDFDPVRAKAEGKKPHGLDVQTAALFPDSFQDSPLGKIPKGWKAGKLGDRFKITMGQSPPGETYNEIGEGMPFFQGRADFSFRYPNRRVYCTAPTRFANPGDTLVCVRAPVGDINMALEPCCVGRGVAAVRHETGSRSYTYYSMRSLSDTFARFEAEGTVFGSINKEDFHDIEWILPSEKVVSEYERIISPLDQTIENNERQSQNLASVRDSFLPKLLSGEIRVKDAEKFL